MSFMVDKLAVISDIHGNLEALERVLEDIDAQGVNEIVCLGDNIGYGPEPEAVVRLLEKREIPSVLGNHELALVKRKNRDWFNPVAREGITRTEQLLSRECIELIAEMPATMTRYGSLFVHGCPPDSVRLYLFEMEHLDLRRIMRSLNMRITFVGHTHELELVSEKERTLIGEGEHQLAPYDTYIINVGSVGQPRDGDNRAKYAIWEPRKSLLTIRFIKYDIKKTADKIIELGFPEQFARRLW